MGIVTGTGSTKEVSVENLHYEGGKETGGKKGERVSKQKWPDATTPVPGTKEKERGWV